MTEETNGMDLETLSRLSSSYDSAGNNELRNSYAVQYMTLARKMILTGELLGKKPEMERREDMRSVEVVNDSPTKQCSYNRCQNPNGRTIGVGNPLTWVPAARPKSNFHRECYLRWLNEESCVRGM